MTDHTEHGTTISAAALQAQLAAAQRDNTRLIARIVELEAQRDVLRDAIRYAMTMGLPGHASIYLADALAVADQRQSAEAVAPPAPPSPAHCWNCGLPLVSAHIRDEVVITKGERRASVHRACASHLTSQGWKILAQTRGLTDAQ